MAKGLKFAGNLPIASRSPSQRSFTDLSELSGSRLDVWLWRPLEACDAAYLYETAPSKVRPGPISTQDFIIR
jgi:hypothetical protein